VLAARVRANGLVRVGVGFCEAQMISSARLIGLYRANW